MRWKPIEDLPADWAELSDGELGPLLQVWKDLRVDLEERGLLQEFNDRLAREWSIETGQIEGVYNLDRGVTKNLIERGLNADLISRAPGQPLPEEIAAILHDHQDVLEVLFEFVKGERSLTRGNIHQLHAALLRSQDEVLVEDQFGHRFKTELLKGRYKERPNNPSRPDGATHEYCPPEQVVSEMDRLLAMHEAHELAGVPVEIASAWLHHRFTEIHPYQDGNGRLARALASLPFLKAGWFPVVVTRDDRTRYIDALESADTGTLQPLMTLFQKWQERALVQAVQVAAEVFPVQTVDEAIAAAKVVLTSSRPALPLSAWLDAKRTADRLMRIVESQLKQASDALREGISDERPDFAFESRIDPMLDEPADIYHRIAEILIKNRRRWALQVVAYAKGSKFGGLIGFIVILKSESNEVQLASDGNFWVNYAEDPENAERRFRPWLEQSIVKALTIWRQDL